MTTTTSPQRQRAAAKEIIPGKLYQRGHFLTWSRGQKDSFLAAYGINTVVNLWSKADNELLGKANDWIYLHWPLDGSYLPNEQVMSIMVGTIYALMNQEGRVTLIHCESGVTRSILVSTLLVARYYGWTGRQALAYVEERCGKAKFSKEQQEYILNA